MVSKFGLSINCIYLSDSRTLPSDIEHAFAIYQNNLYTPLKVDMTLNYCNTKQPQHTTYQQSLAPIVFLLIHIGFKILKNSEKNTTPGENHYVPLGRSLVWAVILCTIWDFYSLLCCLVSNGSKENDSIFNSIEEFIHIQDIIQDNS